MYHVNCHTGLGATGEDARAKVARIASRIPAALGRWRRLYARAVSYRAAADRAAVRMAVGLQREDTTLEREQRARKAEEAAVREWRAYRDLVRRAQGVHEAAKRFGPVSTTRPRLEDKPRIPARPGPPPALPQGPGTDFAKRVSPDATVAQPVYRSDPEAVAVVAVPAAEPGAGALIPLALSAAYFLLR